MLENKKKIGACVNNAGFCWDSHIWKWMGILKEKKGIYPRRSTVSFYSRDTPVLTHQVMTLAHLHILSIIHLIINKTYLIHHHIVQ